jgi:hypothetical protein
VGRAVGCCTQEGSAPTGIGHRHCTAAHDAGLQKQVSTQTQQTHSRCAEGSYLTIQEAERPSIPAARGNMQHSVSIPVKHHGGQPALLGRFEEFLERHPCALFQRRTPRALLVTRLDGFWTQLFMQNSQKSSVRVDAQCRQGWTARSQASERL